MWSLLQRYDRIFTMRTTFWSQTKAESLVKIVGKNASKWWTMRSTFHLCDRIVHHICHPSAGHLTLPHNTYAVALCVMRCPTYRRIDKVCGRILSSLSNSKQNKNKKKSKKNKENKKKRKGENTNNTGNQIIQSSNHSKTKKSICYTHPCSVHTKPHWYVPVPHSSCFRFILCARWFSFIPFCKYVFMCCCV